MTGTTLSIACQLSIAALTIVFCRYAAMALVTTLAAALAPVPSDSEPSFAAPRKMGTMRIGANSADCRRRPPASKAPP